MVNEVKNYSDRLLPNENALSLQMVVLSLGLLDSSDLLITCALLLGLGRASQRTTEPGISILYDSSGFGTSSELSASSF